jgi:peptidyl-prolyl cis-trans isomerase C
MKVALALILTLLFSNCVKSPSPDRYIARVGDSYLTSEELQKMIPENPDIPISPEQKKQIINNWVRTELLYQAGIKQHMERDLEIQEKVRKFKKDLVAQAYLDYLLKKSSVGDTDILKYYNKHKQEFIRKSNAARVVQFLVSDKNEADRVYRILRRGRPELRKKLMEEKGVSERIVDEGNLIPELNNAIFSKNRTGVRAPVSSEFGYHVVQVLEFYSQGSAIPLDLIRDSIIQRLTVELTRNRYDRILDSLKNISDVEILTIE